MDQVGYATIAIHVRRHRPPEPDWTVTVIGLGLWVIGRGPWFEVCGLGLG